MSNVGTDSYTLRMVDQITAPLSKLTEQVERLTEKMDKLSGTVSGGSGLQAVFGRLSGYARIVAEAFGALYKVMEFGITIAARMAYSFGKATLAAVQFRTQNIQALDTFFGRDTGEGIFKKALGIGGITSANELDVVRQVRELGGSGFTGMGLSQANAGLLDVHAMLGQENSDLLREYFGKFYGSSKVEADDLRRTAILSGFGGGEAGLKARLVRNATGQDLTGASAEKQYEALKKAGKIGGKDVIAAVLQGINERLDDGKGLGTAAKKMGEGTLSGLISNLEAAPMRFLAEMRLEKLPGIKSLMEFLKRLLTFFDHGSIQGKKLAKVVEDLTNTLFGGLSKLTDKDLERYFSGALKVAEQLRDTISAGWEILDQMLHGDTTGFVRAFGTGLVEVGKLIGKGILAALFGDDEETKSGQLTGGQLDAYTLELARKAREAGDLTAIFQGAGAKKGSLKAVVQALSKESNLPPQLSEQLAQARANLGMDGPDSGLSSTVADLQALQNPFSGAEGGININVVVNDVDQKDHGQEVARRVGQVLQRAKLRVGAKKFDPAQGQYGGQ